MTCSFLHPDPAVKNFFRVRFFLNGLYCISVGETEWLIFFFLLKNLNMAKRCMGYMDSLSDLDTLIQSCFLCTISDLPQRLRPDRHRQDHVQRRLLYGQGNPAHHHLPRQGHLQPRGIRADRPGPRYAVLAFSYSSFAFLKRKPLAGAGAGPPHDGGRCRHHRVARSAKA